MSKGNYYKRKTMEYFSQLGYVTEPMEKTQRIATKGGSIVFVRRDLLGADGISVNETETILWNSVLGKSNIAEHIKRFLGYPKGGLKRWVIVWEPRKEPEIVDADDCG